MTITPGVDSSIVVTGMGVVCSIGQNIDEFTLALRSDQRGIGPVHNMDLSALRSSFGGEIADFRPSRLAAEHAADLMRGERFAVTVVEEALATACLSTAELDLDRVGIAVGTCQGNAEQLSTVLQGQPQPLTIAPIADAVANVFRFRGPRVVASNACAAGGAAIALARDLLLRGRVDMMFAGGADALTYFSLAGFDSLHSLDPAGCAPYSRSAGLTVGEGAGMIVLERRDDAEARGAPIFAELLGCGLSADAYHPTAPDPSGRGAALAITRAIEQSKVEIGAVDYVNGHGTGTAANDEMERRAFRRVFSDRVSSIPVSSTKSMIGHTLGAAGAIEAIACILALRHGFVPPTLGFEEVLDADLDFVPNHARAADVSVTVSNNYAFGGSNSSVVLAVPGRVARGVTKPPEPVLITGLGVVGGLGVGLEAWRESLRLGRTAIAPQEGHSSPAAAMPALISRGFAPSGAWRKMDVFSRMCVASARLCWGDARMEMSQAELERLAVLLATHAGSLDSVIEFARQAFAKTTIDPHLFPHTALNAASGHICTLFGAHGPNLSISSGLLSGLHALDFAYGMIARGEIDAAMVTCADGFDPALVDEFGGLRGHLGPELSYLTPTTVRPFDSMADGAALGSAAVTVLLEGAGRASARGARAYAELQGIWSIGSETDVGRGRPEAWARAMRGALHDAGVDPLDVGYCVAAATGRRESDHAELAAIGEIASDRCYISAPKSLAGECLAADAGLGLVVACLALADGFLTPTAGLSNPLFPTPARHVVEPTEAADLRACIVNAASGAGSYGSIVLGPPSGRWTEIAR